MLQLHWLSAECQAGQARRHGQRHQPYAENAEKLQRQRNLGGHGGLRRRPCISSRRDSGHEHDRRGRKEQARRVAAAAPCDDAADGRRDEQSAEDDADENPQNQVSGRGRPLLSFPLFRNEDEPPRAGDLIPRDLDFEAELALWQRRRGRVGVSKGPVRPRLQLGWPRRHFADLTAGGIQPELALRRAACSALAAFSSSVAPARPSGKVCSTRRTSPVLVTKTRHSSARSATSPSNVATLTRQRASGRYLPTSSFRRSSPAERDKLPRSTAPVINNRQHAPLRSKRHAARGQSVARDGSCLNPAD